MSQLTMLAQALQLAREAIDALRENATASRELAATLQQQPPRASTPEQQHADLGRGRQDA